RAGVPAGGRLPGRKGSSSSSQSHAGRKGSTSKNSGFQSRESNRPPIPLVPGLRQLAREKADPPFRSWAAITPPWCSPGGVFVATELRSGAGKHRHGNGQASRRTVKWKIAPPARNERAPPRLGPHAAIVATIF